MIKLVSDLHLCHDRDFCYASRGFTSIEEMNESIVDNWNSVVTDEDDVYVLGDVMLNDNDKGMYYLRKLKGKIHIIIGNHDTDTRLKLYESLPNVEVVGYATIIKYKKYRFYLSHYPTLTSNYTDGEGLHGKIINLCGHTHTTDRFLDMDKGMIYHVELDAHNNTPVDIEDIIRDLREYIRGRNNE